MVSEKAECLYVDLLYVDERKHGRRVIRKWKAKRGILDLAGIPSSTSFIAKRTYENLGYII